MGNTFEVYEWMTWRSEVTDKLEGAYENRYRGESFDEAMAIMKKLKADGAHCVKLEWR